MGKQNTQVSCKSSELTLILKKHFGENMNLARIKFISLFICALCNVRTVCFEKCACAFENACDTASSLRRIQRFKADYLLNTDVIAKIIFGLLPHKSPYHLSMDRTNWKCEAFTKLQKHFRNTKQKTQIFTKRDTSSIVIC
jgi:hypothetical protein